MRKLRLQVVFQLAKRSFGGGQREGAVTANVGQDEQLLTDIQFIDVFLIDDEAFACPDKHGVVIPQLTAEERLKMRKIESIDLLRVVDQN